MKNAPRTEPAANKMRYHILRPDGLYAPISFLFVTDRMCQEIAVERQLILENLPEDSQARQLKRFERYDPRHSSAAFNSMLRLFTLDKKE